MRRAVVKLAQFRSVIRGQRGEASHFGSKQSGMTADINGWHTGATVRIDHVDGRDRVQVFRTPGTGKGHSSVLVAEWFEDEATAYPKLSKLVTK